MPIIPIWILPESLVTTDIKQAQMAYTARRLSVSKELIFQPKQFKRFTIIICIHQVLAKRGVILHVCFLEMD